MQDALAVDTFTSSDEAFAADALFDAYRRCVLCSPELHTEAEKRSVPCTACMVVAVVCAIPNHAVGWPVELEHPPVMCLHLACSGEAAAIQGTIKHSPVFTNLDNQASRLLALAVSSGHARTQASWEHDACLAAACTQAWHACMHERWLSLLLFLHPSCSLMCYHPPAAQAAGGPPGTQAASRRLADNGSAAGRRSHRRRPGAACQ